MAKARTNSSSGNSRKGYTALSTDAREKQLIALAVDLAEQQLRDGTASSQLITHYLKLASLEQKHKIEKLQAENELLRAKASSLQSQQRTEEMIADAMKAFRNYSGQGDPDEYNEYDEY